MRPELRKKLVKAELNMFRNAESLIQDSGIFTPMIPGRSDGICFRAAVSALRIVFSLGLVFSNLHFTSQQTATGSLRASKS
jgi:hypothetical protein